MSNDPQPIPDFDALDVLMPEGAPAPGTPAPLTDLPEAETGLGGFGSSSPPLDATVAWSPDPTVAADSPFAAGLPSPEEKEKEEEKAEKEPKPKKPGLWSKLQKADPYTALLGVALVCVTLGCLFLALAWQRYGFDRKPPRFSPRTTSAGAPAAIERLA